MPFIPEDCLDPLGDLDPGVIWPGKSEGDVDAIVQAYLDAGYALAAGAVPENQDEAARQWVYHRAYMSKWRARSGLPSSVTTSDQGSGSFTQGQLDNWKAMADTALAEHERLITALPTVAVVTHLASESVRTVAEW